MFVKMLAAIEGSRGTLTWTDVAIGAAKAAERKRQEAVAAIVSTMPLTDILLIEEIAQREVAAKRSKTIVEVVSEQQTASTSKASKKRRAG